MTLPNIVQSNINKLTTIINGIQYGHESGIIDVEFSAPEDGSVASAYTSGGVAYKVDMSKSTITNCTITCVKASKVYNLLVNIFDRFTKDQIPNSELQGYSFIVRHSTTFNSGVVISDAMVGTVPVPTSPNASKANEIDENERNATFTIQGKILFRNKEITV